MEPCHEGISFLFGLGSHFLFDLLIVPLLIAIGWRAHTVAHDHCGHGGPLSVLRRLIGRSGRATDAPPDGHRHHYDGQGHRADQPLPNDFKS